MTFCHLDFDYHPTSDQEGRTNLIYSVLARSASKGHNYRSMIFLSLPWIYLFASGPGDFQDHLSHCWGGTSQYCQFWYRSFVGFWSTYILICRNMIFHINCLQATFVSIVGYEVKILGEMQPVQVGIWNVTRVSIIIGEDFLRSVSYRNLHPTRWGLLCTPPRVFLLLNSLFWNSHVNTEVIFLFE